MPNIKILGQFRQTVMIEAISASNQMKIERDARVENGEMVMSTQDGGPKVV